jgi:hypothetical protein
MINASDDLQVLSKWVEFSPSHDVLAYHILLDLLARHFLVFRHGLVFHLLPEESRLNFKFILKSWLNSKMLSNLLALTPHGVVVGLGGHVRHRLSIGTLIPVFPD